MPENPVKATIEALYKPIESIVKTLAGPAAEEIGLTFRDSFRFWRFQRQVRLFNRVQEICAETGVRPQAVKLPLLFDIVDKATLEEDDQLQDLWANLLANAADSRQQILVRTTFPDILRQISREEALYLMEMLEVRRKTTAYVPDEYAPYPPPSEDEPEEEITSKLDDISYDNLLRLRLIAPHGGLWPVLTRGTGMPEFLTAESSLITALGEALVLACQAPRKCAP